jgi:hypothetical protein
VTITGTSTTFTSSRRVAGGVLAARAPAAIRGSIDTGVRGPWAAAPHGEVKQAPRTAALSRERGSAHDVPDLGFPRSPLRTASIHISMSKSRLEAIPDGSLFSFPKVNIFTVAAEMVLCSTCWGSIELVFRVLVPSCS